MHLRYEDAGAININKLLHKGRLLNVLAQVSFPVDTWAKKHYSDILSSASFGLGSTHPLRGGLGRLPVGDE